MVYEHSTLPNDAQLDYLRSLQKEIIGVLAETASPPPELANDDDQSVPISPSAARLTDPDHATPAMESED